MSLGVYLQFEGNAREALAFYQEIFGGEPYIMTYKEMPEDQDMEVDPKYNDYIMHAEFAILGSSISLSDIAPGFGGPVVKGSNVQIMLGFDEYNQAKSTYDKLLKDGQSFMPFEKTFWSPGYGLLEDKYGVQWHVNVNSDY